MIDLLSTTIVAMKMEKNTTNKTISSNLRQERMMSNFLNSSSSIREQVLTDIQIQVRVEVTITIKIKGLTIKIIKEEAGVIINETKTIEDSNDSMINQTLKDLKVAVIEVEVNKALVLIEEVAIVEIEIVVVMKEKDTRTTKTTKETMAINIITIIITVDLKALGVVVVNFLTSKATMVITKSIKMMELGKIIPKTTSTNRIRAIKNKIRGSIKAKILDSKTW